MPLGIEVGVSQCDFVLDADPALLPKKGAEPPIFGPCLLRPTGCMDRDATWYGGKPRPDDIVLDGTQLTSPPQFSAHVYCGQPAGWIKIALGTEVGLGPGHIVLEGDPVVLPEKGLRKAAEPHPQFLAHVYCGQTAGCIKMPLGTEVGLSPGNFVLDGDPAAPPQKGAEPPIFGPRLLWPNGCMDQDVTW